MDLAGDHGELDSLPASDPAAGSSQKRRLPRPKAAYPRKRAIRACRLCRLRRTKCDNEFPSCSSCVGLGTECTYQTGDASSFDPASLAILQRLDTLEGLLRAKTDGENDGNESSPRSPGDPSPLPISEELGSPALERSPETVPCYINIEAVLSWPVFEDQGFDLRLDLKSLLQADNNDHRDPPIMSLGEDFESSIADQLLQQFLDNVHIFNPVLEGGKVREYMRSARFNGLGWDAPSCLLLLIYALGSIATPYEKASSEKSSNFRQSAEFRQADSFFLAAQKRMGMLLCRSGVIEAQCFFLAGVYLMSTLRPIEGWKMFVQALACCQGFHNYQRTLDMQYDGVYQLEQSIYWTCFKSELELRLELNVSEKSVWDLTYPAFFPSPPSGLKSQGEAAWFFYLAEIALRRLGNRILNYVYRQKPPKGLENDMNDATANFEDQAAGWLSSLPPTLRLDSNEADDPDHAALKFILNGHLLDCYEMMYWPFIVAAMHGKLRGAAAESFARKALNVCVHRIEKNESGFYHRHHGTWLMLRSCTRSALVLLAAVRCPSLSVLLPMDWELAIYKVKDMLSHWKDESRDVSDRLYIIEKLMGSLDQTLSSR